MRTPSLIIIAVAALQCGATDCGQAIRDPGFDLWCGEQLCSWKLDHGEVDQIPTWNPGDDGVDLLGSDTAIYQLSPVTSADGACLQFDVIADVDPGVDARFQVDIFDDGTMDLDLPIPASRWEPLIYRFTIDGPYQGVQFWVVKHSAGHAAFAQLQAHTCGDGEVAETHVAAGPGPDGVTCAGAAECASGICEQFPTGFPPPATCGACEIGTACPNSGDVCGLVEAENFTRLPSTGCVAMGSKLLGEQCGVNPECANGLCVFGVCSSCFDDSCGAGIACDASPKVPVVEMPLAYYRAPYVCAPGTAAGAAGAPCGTNADCASGACNGAVRRVCADGRACTNDADCPVLSGLDHQVCETVGVIGGTCQ